MFMVLRSFTFYEMPEGKPHIIKIIFDAGCYDVIIDDNYYTTANSEDGAVEEMIRFLDNVWWTAVKPFDKEV